MIQSKIIHFVTILALGGCGLKDSQRQSPASAGTKNKKQELSFHDYEYMEASTTSTADYPMMESEPESPASNSHADNQPMYERYMMEESESDYVGMNNDNFPNSSQTTENSTESFDTSPNHPTCSSENDLYYWAIEVINSYCGFEIAGSPQPEEPAATEEPIISEEPAATEEPIISEEPAATEEPIISEEPAATEEPIISEEPAATEGPIISEEPAATEEPIISEEPAATEEPTSNGEPPLEEDAIDDPQAVVGGIFLEFPSLAKQQTLVEKAMTQPERALFRFLLARADNKKVVINSNNLFQLLKKEKRINGVKTLKRDAITIEHIEWAKVTPHRLAGFPIKEIQNTILPASRVYYAADQTMEWATGGVYRISTKKQVMLLRSSMQRDQSLIGFGTTFYPWISFAATMLQGKSIQQQIEHFEDQYIKYHYSEHQHQAMELVIPFIPFLGSADLAINQGHLAEGAIGFVGDFAMLVPFVGGTTKAATYTRVVLITSGGLASGASTAIGLIHFAQGKGTVYDSAALFLGVVDIVFAIRGIHFETVVKPKLQVKGDMTIITTTQQPGTTGDPNSASVYLNSDKQINQIRFYDGDGLWIGDIDSHGRSYPRPGSKKRFAQKYSLHGHQGTPGQPGTGHNPADPNHQIDLNDLPKDWLNVLDKYIEGVTGNTP